MITGLLFPRSIYTQSLIELAEIFHNHFLYFCNHIKLNILYRCGLFGALFRLLCVLEHFFVEYSTISPDRPFLSLCSTSWAHILLISSRRSLKQHREGENIVTTAKPSYTGVPCSLTTAVNVNLTNFHYSYLLGEV